MKRAQQRLYFSRRLSGFGVSGDVLLLFYRAVIESVLTLAVTVWFGNIAVDDRSKLDKVVKTASRIIGRPLTPLDEVYRKGTLKRVNSIIKDAYHPVNELFVKMRKLYRSLPGSTRRSNRSFRNTAIRYLNGNFDIVK